MSKTQLQEVDSQVLESLIIVEHLIQLFKSEDEQRACIVMEALDILPKLESNLQQSYEIITH